MLRESLKRIMTEWPKATKEKFTNHPIANAIRHEFRNVIISIIAEKYPNYIVSASAGAGGWANVPWISILNPEITKTTQDGIYPVYLFCADGNGVYLSLNQGTTTPKNEYGKTRSDKQSNACVNKIRLDVPQLAEWGRKKIELRASTALGKSYENSNIAARYYSVNSLPSEEELKEDLLVAMNFYDEIEPIWREVQIQNALSPLSQAHHKMNTTIPKPFLLLAGISGTGKTRFVREQANASHHEGNPDNYCLIPVRPDWHEPSDLLGYISRIGGVHYVVTDLLRFVVQAWQDAATLATVSATELPCKPVEEMTPYWLCLDEMNLAPVEQYFADYLSVLETREWKGDEYTCDPLLKAASIEQLDPDGRLALRADLKLTDSNFDGLWQYFLKTGIPLPPNLIVAGTVNMDETTHGFSRKVIDRAFTVDFGVFYPNDFNEFLLETKSIRPKILSFPLLSQATENDLKLIAIDAAGKRSIGFLSAINAVLKDTPFELAYRALNELLLAVVCFKPETDATLQAVWDDFLMSKVLPRIDGDAEKLSVEGELGKVGSDTQSDVLTTLLTVIEIHFEEILTNKRPDLLRENQVGTPLMIECRAIPKLKWMKKRLISNGFTTFWP